MGAAIDVVTVFHNIRNHAQHLELRRQLTQFEDGLVNFIAVNNSQINRGFAAGCNLGASQGSAPIIGCINPDAQVFGPFVEKVHEALSDPKTVICGCRFGKPQRELEIWKVKSFVCGAAFFVRRTWFEFVGGFDERYEWSHEELDLIRTAESQNLRVVELDLPIYHESPADDIPKDANYKRIKFEQAAKAYRRKWADG